MYRIKKYLIVYLVASFPLSLWAAQSGRPIEIEADLTAAAQNIYHVRMVMPVSPGPLNLYYPKWLPGQHRPVGPVADLAGLTLSDQKGRAIEWRRDALDMYQFHVTIPAHAKTLTIKLDLLFPEGNGGIARIDPASDQLAVLNWERVLLYPKGKSIDEIPYQASVKLPDGWHYGTALTTKKFAGNQAEFAQVSLRTLVDSPVAAGAHYRKLDLTTDETSPPHRLHLFADANASLQVPDNVIQAYRKLIPETFALFGSYPYRKYDFLLSLSDHIEWFGHEHFESSDNRLPEGALTTPGLIAKYGGLLAHELFHAWNGKYVRPVGLYREDYQAPYIDDLLWVYEGLTRYYGEVLAVRSGLRAKQDARQQFALIAAQMDHRRGREWRTLADTTRSTPIMLNFSPEWSSWRRGSDYYDEGLLLWLEVDVLLRQKSGNRYSLDDFCRLFYHRDSGSAQRVQTYTYEKVITTLQQVVPFAWDEFFKTRIEQLTPQAPLAGLNRSGWSLVYTEQRNGYLAALEETDRSISLAFSLGMVINGKSGLEYGRILDVIPDLPANNAGIGPGMKLIAVNSRAWNGERLNQALKPGPKKAGPIELLIEHAGFYKTYRLDYEQGARYPNLTRNHTQADLLGAIFESKSP